jgi:hypothetical protein
MDYYDHDVERHSESTECHQRREKKAQEPVEMLNHLLNILTFIFTRPGIIKRLEMEDKNMKKKNLEFSSSEVEE